MPSYSDPRDPRRTGQAPAQPRRRKKRRRRLPVPRIVLILFLVGGVLFLRGVLSDPTPSIRPLLTPIRSRERRKRWETASRPSSRAGPGGARARDILAHLEDYPQEPLELAVRNPETVDFVADYPQEKDRAPAVETVGGGGAGDHPSAPPVGPPLGLCPVRGRAHGPQRLRPHRPVHGDLRPHRGRRPPPPARWPSTPRRWGTTWMGWAPAGS